MERFVFIKGKNPELSRLELVSYLDSRDYKYSVVDDSEDFIVIDMEMVFGMIDSLGGTLKIANVLTEGDDINKVNLEKLELGKLLKKNIFGLSVYSKKDQYEIYNSIGKKLKGIFKEEGIKAKYFGFPKHRKPQMSNVEVIKKKLIEDSFELVVCISEKRFYVGITNSLHNPLEFQKRDIGRPVQRIIFSIPPRLANILINLACAKEGDTLLDPFCGIGTILQEAALKRIDISGIDKDEKCIESAKQNLKWLADEYRLKADFGRKIMAGDAMKLSKYFKKDSIDAIATEPYLGPPLKGNQNQNNVKKLFDEIRPLYEKSLKEMHKVLKSGKRIAIVSPCIRTREDKVIKFDFEKIAVDAGFKIIDSVIDAEKRHRTLREIFVIEKS
jgi:tRNA G10  N-methylase Trm11